MPLTDPVFYLVALPAVLLTGISKGGFGGALGGIAVPLMALAISPVQAAAIMLPVLCLMDLVGFRVYYGKWDVANLRIMLPGAVIGILVGTLTFGLFSERAIRILIGTIAIAFPIVRWLGIAERQSATGLSRPKGILWSAASGFTSFVAHAGGPPAMIWLLPQHLDKITYVATINLFFLVVNAVKLVPYAWLGQFSAVNLLTCLVLSPLVPAGVWLGLWLQRHVNQKWFYRIAQGGMLATGVQLLWQELTR